MHLVVILRQRAKRGSIISIEKRIFVRETTWFVAAQDAIFPKAFDGCDSQIGRLVTVNNRHREERHGGDRGLSRAGKMTPNSKYIP